MTIWEQLAQLLLKLIRKRERDALKEIEKAYEEILGLLLLDVGKIYQKHEKEGKVSYADVNRFRDLDNLKKRVVRHVSSLDKKKKEAINKLLEESFDESYSHMSYTIEKAGELQIEEAVLKSEPIEIYEQIVKELKKEMKELNRSYERKGSLSYKEIYRYRQLESMKARVLAQSTLFDKSSKKRLEAMLEEGKGKSYVQLSGKIQAVVDKQLDGITPHMPEILEKVRENPIYGLRLPTAMERDRQIIVKDINGAIERGLIAGDTYGTMANKIQEVFDSSKNRANKIARTETHRVREQATHTSAMNADRQGVKMIKIWRNMDDERVRPSGVQESPPRKNQANHVVMEAQTVKETEKFVSPTTAAKGYCPGSMGRADEDINCRCYVSRKIDRIEPKIPKKAVKETFKDWKKLKSGE